MNFEDDRGKSLHPQAGPEVRDRVISGGSVSPNTSVRTAPAGAVPTLAGDDVESRAVGGRAVPGVEIDEMFGVEEDEYSEGEADVPESDYEEFVDRMQCMGVQKDSQAWKSYWRTHAEERLKHYNPDAFAEYERRKGKRARVSSSDKAAEPEQASEPVPDEATEPEQAAEPGPAVDDDSWCDLEDGGEESRVLRMCPPCNPPTAEEVRQHNMSGHCVFRNWCPVCVAAAADERAHGPRQEQEGSVPEVASDYAFFRNRKGDRTYLPVLISKVRKPRGFNAHAVPSKGTGGGWIVQQFLRDLRKWGLRSDVIFKSDGEASIIDLLNRVGDLQDKGTQLETSPVGDSRANGLAERAVQSVQKQVRTLKLALERNLGSRVEVTHPCFPWLIEHAADVLNQFLVSSDGRTAWERLKGRRYGGLMFEFGSKILYKVPQKPQGGAMEPGWMPAVWLGKCFVSDEHIIALEDGRVVRAGTVRGFPGEEFSKEIIDSIIGKPWDPKGTGMEQGDLHTE